MQKLQVLKHHKQSVISQISQFISIAQITIKRSIKVFLMILKLLDNATSEHQCLTYWGYQEGNPPPKEICDIYDADMSKPMPTQPEVCLTSLLFSPWCTEWETPCTATTLIETREQILIPSNIERDSLFDIYQSQQAFYMRVFKW